MGAKSTLQSCRYWRCRKAVVCSLCSMTISIWARSRDIGDNMPETSYQLTNRYYGPSSPLCVNTSTSNHGLFAGDNDCALAWTITQAATNGAYNICTSYKGTNYCLDIVNPEGGTCPIACTTPHLGPLSAHFGQQWRFISESLNYYKLSNFLTGSGWYLDTYAGTPVAFMSNGNHDGQYWSFATRGGSSRVALSALPTSRVSHGRRRHCIAL